MQHSEQDENILPLHKTVHWRKLKNIIQKIANYEEIDLGSYDLNHIRCYSIIGSSLNGSTVHFANLKNNRSIFVSDNNYDMFEIPKLSNKNTKSFGKFLFLAHNKDFDYWLFRGDELHKSKEICQGNFIN